MEESCTAPKNPVPLRNTINNNNSSNSRDEDTENIKLEEARSSFEENNQLTEAWFRYRHFENFRNAVCCLPAVFIKNPIKNRYLLI